MNRDPVMLLRELHDYEHQGTGRTNFDTCGICAPLRDALTNGDGADRRAIETEATVYATVREALLRRIPDLEGEALSSAIATVFIQVRRQGRRW